MPVYYDTEAEEFMIGPDNCPDCGDPLYDTGCDASGCSSRCCMDCGTGCDIELNPDNGRCAAAIDAESDEDRDDRIDAERSAFGLAPLRDTDA